MYHSNYSVWLSDLVMYSIYWDLGTHRLQNKSLVRLEFEIKLEPLLLPSATAAAAATTAPTPTLF